MASSCVLVKEQENIRQLQGAAPAHVCPNQDLCSARIIASAMERKDIKDVSFFGTKAS
jgi:hypothetical protein